MKVYQATFFSLLIGFAFFLISCSGGNSPIVPDDNSSLLPTEFKIDQLGNREIIAVYDAMINPEDETFILSPANRIGSYHFNLTSLNNNVLSIVGYGFTPNFWADIKLTHPLPGSGIDAFDPRVIAILPARAGVCMNYPNSNVLANNKVVTEPDGYTKLFDNFDSGIAGNTNPFKAYFKSQQYRRWQSTGTTSEIQRWNMNLSGFGGSMQFRLAVDVSTNYPVWPRAIIDNAPEPVEIGFQSSVVLPPNGGSVEIQVIAQDWQGPTGTLITVEAPSLFTNSVPLSYEEPGPSANTYIFSGMISNDNLAPVGTYNILVAAKDQTSGVLMYNEFSVTVDSSGDTAPPVWDSTVGITALVALYDSVEVRYGSAHDDNSPPVEYLVYLDTDPYPFDTEPRLIRLDYGLCYVKELPLGEYWAGVRVRDSANPSNIDNNDIVLSCFLPTRCPDDNNNHKTQATILDRHEYTWDCVDSSDTVDWYMMNWISSGGQINLHVGQDGSEIGLTIWSGDGNQKIFWNNFPAGSYHIPLPAFLDNNNYIEIGTINSDPCAPYALETDFDDPPQSWSWDLVLRELKCFETTEFGEDEPYIIVVISDQNQNVIYQSAPPFGQDSDGNDLWSVSEGGFIRDQTLWRGLFPTNGEKRYISLFFLESDWSGNEYWVEILKKSAVIACNVYCDIFEPDDPACYEDCQTFATIVDWLENFVTNSDDVLGIAYGDASYTFTGGLQINWVAGERTRFNGQVNYLGEDLYEFVLSGDGSSYTVHLRP
jgi:hypothetical protein